MHYYWKSHRLPSLTEDEEASGVEEACGDRWARLRSLKDRYDLTNFFRLNANIEPTQIPT
jgi:hypothetical protein